jgi:hypothetical protein
MADDGGLVRKDADHAGSAFDLLVDPLQRVGRPHLGPVVAGEGGEGPTVAASGWAKIVLNTATMSLWVLGTSANTLRAKCTQLGRTEPRSAFH